MTKPSVSWRLRNRAKKLAHRLRYPPPLYRKVGGISAVVIHADGSRLDHGEVSVTYARRWKAASG